MLRFQHTAAFIPHAGVKPLVLLHGFCEDLRIWTETLWTDLSDLPVVAIDLPGFGGSPMAAEPGMDVCAGAVSVLMQTLGIGQFVLLGHSMGGYVALEALAQNPRPFAGIGLIHSHPFADDETRIANRRRGIGLLRSGKQDAYVAQLFPGLFDPEWASAHPAILNDLTAKAQRYPSEAIAQALEGMIARADHSDTLRKAPCPVLIVAGERDVLIPPTMALEAAAMPTVCQIELLADAAHMGMYESPERLARIIRDFYDFCTTAP